MEQERIEKEARKIAADVYREAHAAVYERSDDWRVRLTAYDYLKQHCEADATAEFILYYGKGE